MRDENLRNLAHFACVESSEWKVAILVYSDASSKAEAAQMSCVAGHLVVESKKGPILHPPT